MDFNGPPFGVPVEEKVPMEKMIRERAFDTAADCEAAKWGMLKMLVQTPGAKDSDPEELRKKASIAYLGSLCVLTSAVYPPHR